MTFLMPLMTSLMKTTWNNVNRRIKELTQKQNGFQQFKNLSLNYSMSFVSAFFC